MRLSRRQALISAVGLALGFVRQSEAAAAADFAEFDAALVRHSVGVTAVRASLAVAYQERLVHARGFGGAEPSDRFLLASGSKTITAAAIATLVQAGRLSLETRIGETLRPWFAANGAPADARVQAVTVLQLLTHTGGLAGSDAADPMFGPNLLALLRQQPPARLGKRELYDSVRQVPLRAPPGSGYRYSNLGYFYLGLIAEAASGQGYNSYCQEQVLRRSGVRQATIEPDLRFADAFAGWRMSAPELLKFLQVFEPENTAVLDRRFHRFVQTPSAAVVPLAGGAVAYYTLGLYLRLDGARPIWWHPGALEFHSSSLNRSAAALLARGDNGASWVAFYEPQPARETPGRIDFLEQARRVSRWPADDRFPQFGLPAAKPR